MEISDVKQQIKTGNLDKIYILYGEEYQVIKIYLKMMAKKANLELTYADSLMDIMTGAKTKSLIQSHHLYVIMDDKEYLTNEKMWEQFKGLKEDIVVFYYTSADKRLKFWKNNKDRAIEFTKLDSQVLTKYIKKDAPLSDSACEKLIDICQNDYGRILLEIDKIRAYSIAKAITPDGAFEELVKQKVLYYQPKDAIFDFVAAFLERKPSKAYNLLQQSKAVGEASLVMISVLYNNIKTLLQIQSAKDYKKLGLNGFAIKNVIGYRNNYSNGELVRAMKLLRECEIGIKTGAVPDELAVDYFLVQIL